MVRADAPPDDDAVAPNASVTFDLLPPQVAVRVEPRSARLRFCFGSDAAAAAIKQRELRFTANTWGAAYKGTEPVRLLEVARAQLHRIGKYRRRGFTLTKPDGEHVEAPLSP